MDNFGFLKVAAAVPHVRVADCDYNTERMAAMAEEAARRGVEIVAFPELGVTAYTCGDLLLQQTLLDAADEALERLVRATRKLPLTLIAGAPLRHGSTLYNCAVVFTQGKVLGVVPKTYIPDYGEFYENRWFASGAGISDEHIAVAGQQADFGADLTFEVNGAEFGIEICEDLWTAAPPSSQLALNGAKVIFNLSASPESVGKHAYLRQLVAQQSGRAIAAYVYCSAGFGESTTDLVFAGNAVIAENGCILREAARFSPDEQLVVADVDIERLEFERRRNTSFRANEGATENTVIEMEIPEGLRGVALDRDIDPMPFVPKDEADRSERCEEIFRIQSHGLAQRMVHTRSEKAVVGISGGLDSTLALLVTARTFDFLHLDRAGIIGITMPGFGTTDRTYNNALELMRGLGVTIREIPIRDACTQHFQDIGLDPGCRGAAYENAQARERTQILMDVANMEGGLVIGTGDLSELALGWATYNGDQMSMYGVNASVPKTLVRHLVKWAAATEQDAATRATLLDIIDTPVSPELLPADDNGKIAQKTEDLVGPYELHDFFLYNFLRAGYGPAKILLLAEQAFDGSYDRAAILRWLTVFVRRFFTQQFKRSAMPDGPKVGSVTLSPRGDWRMPSDASAAAWLRELDIDPMKKLLLFTASLLLLGGTTSSAQDWKEALKKAATAAADKATDGKLTQYALAGTWNYTGPGVKFEGGDIASEVGGAALETAVVKQLEKAYAKAGIRPGAGTFTFGKDDDAFTATLGSHTLSGTYEYDAPTHVVTLHFAKGKLNLGSVPGHAYISGQELVLVFPVTRLVEVVTALGSKVSYFSTATTLLSKYKNVYVGFAFSK